MLKKIQISRVLFEETWAGLNRIGRGATEAVAVWGGTRGSQIEVVKKVYYIDQGGVLRRQRLHRIPAEEINNLFSRLRADGLSIIADVHTHPSEWVGLSPVDEANPTEFRIGFVSVVIPSFGSGTASVREIGFHVYEGDGEWRDVDPETLLELT